MAALFRGQAVALTSDAAFWTGDFRPVEQIPPPVRHALGYELFADLVTGSGDDPAVLATDTHELVRYLRQHRSALITAGNPMLDSAGVFLGNNLISRVADARWQVIDVDKPEVCQGRPLGGGAVVLGMVRAILAADEDRLSEFWTFLRRWDDHDAELEDASQRLALRQDLRVTRTRYRRPDGADLVGALDALIGYITTHYRATATETAPLFHDPTTESPTVRTIRVTPAAPDAAALVIAIDSTAAIAVRAGALQEFAFYGPNTDALETTLLAIAAGAYREAYPIGIDGFVGYHLGSIDHTTESSGTGLVGAIDLELRTAAAAQLADLPKGWTAWELRTMSSP